MAYMAVAATQDKKETAPVVMVTRVWVDPLNIARQNDKATLFIRARKSPRCVGAILHGVFNTPEGMIYDRDPQSGLVEPQWILDAATAQVKFITSRTNAVGGLVDASGGVENAPRCEVKGNPLVTSFTVE
ncbi:MAG: hypothetical protein ACUVS7_09785 [Bryobacteraceae bacterium]